MSVESKYPKHYVPLPCIDFDQHGVEFRLLGLPQGFDDEQLLVNVNRIRLIAGIGGLGGVIIVGGRGNKTDDTPSIMGVDDNGTAMAGSTKYQRKQPVANGVALLTDPNTRYINVFEKPDVAIGLNVRERDERLRTSHSPKRHLDPVGHAAALDETLSLGLSQAARLRHQGSGPAFDRTLWPSCLAVVLSSDIAEVATKGHTDAMSLKMYGVYGVILSALSWINNRPFGKTYLSPIAGLDRRVAAQGLAKYSTFVKARP